MRTSRNMNRYFLLIAKLAGLGLLVLMTLSFLGGPKDEKGRTTVDMSKLSAPSVTRADIPKGTTIWKLGTHNGSAAEFAKPAAGAAELAVGREALTADTLSRVPSGLDGKKRPELKIQYNLNRVPEHGVLFRVSILDAYKSVPQMSVFSNRQLSGIIQIAGVAGTGIDYNFVKTYELYIPKEQLRAGSNELKLRTERCLYCSSEEDAYLWWTWDDLSLSALNAPISEPIHGSYIETGTMVANKQFYYDQGAVDHLPYILKWLGLAYSGNVMRASCASDVGNACSKMEEYYKVLKDYNMQSVVLYLYTADIKLKKDGSLSDEAAGKLSDYFKKYGSYFQYFEVDNEPGLFNRSQAVDLAIAQWLNKQGKTISPEMKSVAPGWAYWPGYSAKSCGNQRGSAKQCGDPDGWERDPKQRMELEEVTDLTNGHSYGESYVSRDGGSFTENLKTFGGSADGLPKQMLTTEFGTSDSHVDAWQYGADQKTSAVFDRIMRAHIGYADMFVQHAAFFKNFSLFEYNFNLNDHDPAKTRIYYTKKGEESRVSIMRRLTLAYATHGAPLTYVLANRDELADKKVYVRAVDTSKLDPLPVSGATSDKVLVNLVNFESTEQTVEVAVTMPEAVVYEGERFGSGDTYETARRYVGSLKASPSITFREKLAPGEAVQYILEPSARVKDTAPAGLTAEAVRGSAIRLNWKEVPGISYEVLRADGSSTAFKAIAKGVTATSYTDRSVREGTLYTYAVRRTGSEQMSKTVQITATGLVPLDRSEWKVSANVNGENGYPGKAIDGDSQTRWDTGVNQKPDERYEIDLGAVHSFEALEMSLSPAPYDYPRRYEISVSDDGSSWRTIQSGLGRKGQSLYPLGETRGRYIRIRQTGSGGNYWSIYELQVYSRE